MSCANVARGVKLTRAKKTCPRRIVQVVAVQSFDSTQLGVGNPPEQAVKLTRALSAAKTKASKTINLNILEDFFNSEQLKLSFNETCADIYSFFSLPSRLWLWQK